MMRKILFLNPSAEIGGGERALLNLLDNIRRIEPDTHLTLLLTKEGPLVDEAAKLGVEVIVEPMPRRMLEVGDSAFGARWRLMSLLVMAFRAAMVMPSLMLYVRRLRKAIERVNPTIIHSNGFKTHVLGWLVRWPHAPLVWHLRDFLSVRPIVPRMIQPASRAVYAVIAISQAVAEDARRLLPGIPVPIVYDGIDTKNFVPGPYDGPALEELAGLPPAPAGVVRIGIVAAYARWKGQALFLEAAALYLKDRPYANVRFFVIGGPIYSTRGSQFSERELRDIAQRLRIASYVGFIGFQKNTAPMFRALDVVVHASTMPEPFGLTIAEGMACGRAVIVAQAGGAAELFTSGQDALGFTPRDAKSLRNAMQKLIEDADLRNALASRSRHTVLTRFDRDRVGPEVLAVFDQALADFQAGFRPKRLLPEPELPRLTPSYTGATHLAELGSKLRLVFMNPVGELGGGERNLLDIITIMHESLPEAKLHLVCFADGPFCDAVRELGVPVTILPLPEQLASIGDSALKGAGTMALTRLFVTRFLSSLQDMLAYSSELQKVLADLKPSIIHTNGIKCHLMPSIVHYPNAPVLWQMQDFVGTRPVVNRALRWASKFAHGTISISEAVAKDISAAAPRLPTTVVYSAIDTDYFSPSADRPYDLDALAGLPPPPPGTLRVALVAAYARWKGQDVFLDAAAKVIMAHPDAPVRFFIVGGPIYKTVGSQFTIEELKARARELKIDDQVGFVPFQQDVAQVYRSLDIFVHASKQPEPFGRTIVEAMATAKPVIVSRAGGAAELFTHGHDAMGVTPNDSSALAETIMRLLRNPELRTTLAHNARRTAIERFSRERMIPEFHHLYEQTLESYTSSHPRRDPLRDVTRTMLDGATNIHASRAETH
jgi:glycosyltransferase involved in cell wall biosynthesis